MGARELWQEEGEWVIKRQQERECCGDGIGSLAWDWCEQAQSRVTMINKSKTEVSEDETVVYRLVVFCP